MISPSRNSMTLGTANYTNKITLQTVSYHT